MDGTIIDLTEAIVQLWHRIGCQADVDSNEILGPRAAVPCARNRRTQIGELAVSSCGGRLDTNWFRRQCDRSSW